VTLLAVPIDSKANSANAEYVPLITAKGFYPDTTDG